MDNHGALPYKSAKLVANMQIGPSEVLNICEEFKKYEFQISHLKEKIIQLIANRDAAAVKRIDNFWTVGSASYKDRPLYTEHEYQNYIKLMNEIMLQEFKELYKYQIHYFEKLTGKKCTYRKDVSIPGFHCFRGCKEFEQPLARPHVDIPHNQFDWGQHSTYEEIFTHVVGVSIPKGAGMTIWPITSKDIAQHGIAEIKKILPKISSHYLPHKENQLVKHSGRWLHQIKPFRKNQEGEWRITLQSHAILIDDVWNLYW